MTVFIITDATEMHRFAAATDSREAAEQWIIRTFADWGIPVDEDRFAIHEVELLSAEVLG